MTRTPQQFTSEKFDSCGWFVINDSQIHKALHINRAIVWTHINGHFIFKSGPHKNIYKIRVYLGFWIYYYPGIKKQFHGTCKHSIPMSLCVFWLMLTIECLTALLFLLGLVSQ